MSTIAKGKLIWAGSLYDSGAPVKTYPEAAAQSFKKGEIVAVNTATGRVAIPAVVGALLDISTVIDVGNSDRILGLALRDASGVTGTAIPVQIIRPGDILEGNLVQGTASPGTDHTLVAADKGCTVGLLRDSSAKQWYPSTDITEPCGKVIDVAYGGGRGVLGDTNARVQFVLTPSMLLVAPYTEIT